MKKSVKIMSILLMSILLVSFMTSNVFAGGAQGVLDNLQTEINSSATDVGTGALLPTFAKVIKFLRNISIIAAVIIIIVLGIKYMMGSIEQKAEYQKNFVPLIVGIILVVSATSIASFLFSIMA